MRLGLVMVRPQQRYWFELIGVEIVELVGFEVSRVLLKTMHLSHEAQGWIDRYDRFGDYS